MRPHGLTSLKDQRQLPYPASINHAFCSNKGRRTVRPKHSSQLYFSSHSHQDRLSYQNVVRPLFPRGEEHNYVKDRRKCKWSCPTICQPNGTKVIRYHFRTLCLINGCICTRHPIPRSKDFFQNERVPWAKASGRYRLSSKYARQDALLRSNGLCGLLCTRHEDRDAQSDPIRKSLYHRFSPNLLLFPFLRGNSRKEDAN